jgi:hypothetical protein
MNTIKMAIPLTVKRSACLLASLALSFISYPSLASEPAPESLNADIKRQIHYLESNRAFSLTVATTAEILTPKSFDEDLNQPWNPKQLFPPHVNSRLWLMPDDFWRKLDGAHIQYAVHICDGEEQASIIGFAEKFPPLPRQRSENFGLAAFGETALLGERQGIDLYGSFLDEKHLMLASSPELIKKTFGAMQQPSKDGTWTETLKQSTFHPGELVQFVDAGQLRAPWRPQIDLNRHPFETPPKMRTLDLSNVLISNTATENGKQLTMKLLRGKTEQLHEYADFLSFRFFPEKLKVTIDFKDSDRSFTLKFPKPFGVYLRMCLFHFMGLYLDR